MLYVMELAIGSCAASYEMLVMFAVGYKLLGVMDS